MRTAEITRSTKETQITVWLSLDGGPVEISTGVGFFDHMLTLFAAHGLFDLTLDCDGDIEVDLRGQAALHLHLRGNHFAEARLQQHIVERKSFGLNPFIDKRHNERGFLLLANVVIIFETA